MQIFLRQIFKYSIAWLALVSLCYLFVRALPGQEFRYELAADHFANLELLSKSLRNSSWLQGLFEYVFSILRGDWGRSALFENSDILEVLKPSLFVTFKLSAFCFLFISISLYFLLFLSWNFRARHKVISMIHFFFSLLAQIPLVVWAPACIYFLSVKWHLFPAALLESPMHYVLPLLVLCVRPISHAYLLLVRELQDLQSSDFIRYAMGKGLTNNQIFFGHIVKLLMPRYLSYFLPTMAGLLSGSLLVEFLFAINGMGFLFYRAFESRDLHLISGICIVVGTYYLALKWIAEILIFFFEPRSVSLDGAKHV